MESPPSIFWKPERHRKSKNMQIKENNAKACVAINPATSVDMILPILPIVDMVLIMSVNPGFGGQKFIEFSLDKIKEVRELNSKIEIEVDGGINSETAKKCVDAGATVLVAGSYVFGGDYKERIDSLRF